MRYIKTCARFNPEQVRELAKKFNVSEIVIKILFDRQVDTEEKIKKFLNSSEQDLHNPHELYGIEELIKRVNKAKAGNEKVVVFGDYDVDGICASYILSDYLTSVGMNVSCFLPHRIADGYGLTETAIDEVIEKFNPSLIITVDCGISCAAEVEYARGKGIEVIVTDHHDIPDEIPNTIVVNPKLENQSYPFKKLCGAGVAFKIVEALSNRKTALKYISIAAIATVADIVSLTDENRAIVQLGLKNIEHKIPIGLTKLIDLCQIDKINAQSIAFKLAPKINAPGRLGDSSLVLDLFLEKNEAKAEKIAEEIIDINLTRQELGQKIYNDCVQKLENINLSETRAIILKDDNWESGLLGIACAKLCSELNKPVVLFANVEGTLKGSGRSISGVNIVEAFKYASEAILNYGGHELAGGLSVKEECFDEFARLFNEFCAKDDLASHFEKFIEFDEDIDLNDITLGLANELEKLEPLGCENKNPLFRIRFNECKIIASKKDSEHLQVEINGKRFMAFNGIKFKLRLLAPGEKEAIIEIVKSEYKGHVSAKGYIKHVMCKPNYEQEIYLGFLEKAMITNYRGSHKFDYITLLPEPKFGICYVTYFKSTAKFYSRNLNIKIEEFYSADNTGESVIMLAPQTADVLKNYHTIVFLDGLIKNFISKLNQLGDFKILVLENAKYKFPAISCDRELFGKCFKKLKLIESGYYYNLLDFYYSNLSEFVDISFSEFLFALKVFEELDFVEVSFTATRVLIKFNHDVKRELNESIIYRRAKYILESRKNNTEAKND